MVEQYQPITTPGLIRPDIPAKTIEQPMPTSDGKDFKTLLMESIQEVNRLQADADEATVNLAIGKTDNVAEVFTAVKKAELAFQTLMQMRNKLLDAYNEIKEMRI
jgi:flagellar hook-basal body complex protein FliE